QKPKATIRARPAMSWVAGLASRRVVLNDQVACMISLEDCIALCGLTEEEVLAIAEHEHVPECAATVLGRYLLDQPEGLKKIQRMIVDDIRHALDGGNVKHASELVCAMRHLMATHPERTNPLSSPAGRSG